MYAFEAWKKIDDTLNHELLDSACLNEKKLYRHVVQDMCQNLRRRPMMILQMPRAERHMLFRPLLELPHFDLMSQNLIIQWLKVSQVTMMNAFLDALEIAHDKDGFAENFPETVSAEKLKKAVDGLYAAFSEGHVTLYLNVFDRITGVRWSALAPLVKNPAEAAA